MHIPSVYTIDLEGEQIVTVNVKRKRVVLAQEVIKKLQFNFTSGPPFIVTPKFSVYRSLFRIPTGILASYHPQSIEIDEDFRGIDLEAPEDFSQILDKRLEDISIRSAAILPEPDPRGNVEYIIFGFQDGASLHLSAEAPRTFRYPLTIRTKWIMRGLY